MSKMTLFELTATIEDVLHEIIDAEIDRDAEALDGLYSELDGLYENRESKLEGYVHVIKNSDALMAACKAEANAFYARAKALENLTRRLKDTLHDDLIAHDAKRADAGKFLIRRQNGPPRVVVTVEASELPTDYQRVTIEADKTALKNAIKNGESVDGVKLENTEHLRIIIQ